MENDVMGEQREELRERWIFSVIILVVLFFSLSLYLYQNESWLAVLPQFVNWLARPQLNYTTIYVEGGLEALFAGVQIIVLGTIISRMLLKTEEVLLKRVTALGLGLGVIGLVTIVLAITGLLTRTILATSLALLTVFFTLMGAFFTVQKFHAKEVLNFFVSSFSIWKTERKFKKSWLILIFPSAVIFFFIYLHATLHPIYHWDALFYHASIANILFHERSFPFIVGLSSGIGMSGNYPLSFQL